MRKRIGGLIIFIVFFFAASASSAPIGFELHISGDYNTPEFQLTNTGALDIEEFEMTIGNTAYNFDFVQNVVSGGIPYTLIAPDTSNNGARTDYQKFTFTDFIPGAVFQWETNLDPDNSNVVVDYRGFFFNNGDAPNSMVTVLFTDGAILQGTFPDASTYSSYTMSVSGESSQVPIPAAFWLFGSGLAGVIGLRRRFKG